MKNLIKTSLLFLIITASLVYSQAKFSQINSMPGAFSRLGFGARGIGMGNALSAVNTGEQVSYYNPALIIFQKGNSFNTSFSILSLDRRLNFVNFTKRFGEPETKLDEKFSPAAGISVGMISAGVSKIDQRDDEGMKVGDLSTSETQFFLGLANHFSRRISAGIAFKLYYYKLYEGLSSTSLGIDLGILYLINDDLTASLVISDLMSKYKWDTSVIFSSGGQTTEDKFPLLKKIGLSYKLFESKLITGAEFEWSNADTYMFRFGAEYNLYQDLFLRMGIDRVVINNSDIPMRPSFGFTYNYHLSSYIIGINYAYTVEPYSAWNAHIFGVNINF